MGKIGVISKYKSDAVKYLQKNNILREDAVICYNQDDIDGNKGKCTDVVVLSSWYGFDAELSISLLKSIVKKDVVKPVGEIKEIVVESNDVPEITYSKEFYTNKEKESQTLKQKRNES